MQLLVVGLIVAMAGFIAVMLVWPFVLVGQMRTVAHSVPAPQGADLETEWHSGWYEPALGPLDRQTCRAYHVRYRASVDADALLRRFSDELSGAGFAIAPGPATGPQVVFTDRGGDPDVWFRAVAEATQDGGALLTVTATRYCEEGFVP
jgi:hypothetical protein